MVRRSHAHESLFSYGIARPYPYRWFTPIAACLCVVAIIFFSVVNIASSGYTLVAQLTKDPKATLAQNTWLEHWPSFASSKIRPTCQPLTIPVDTELYTNNTALTYRITNVCHESLGFEAVSLWSLLYQNNPLEECSVNSIDMVFDYQGMSATQLLYSTWGVRVSAYTTCSINISPLGPTLFNLTMDYNYVPPTVRFGDQSTFLGSAFLNRNSTTQSSLYWGESLLSTTWAVVCRQLQDIGSDLEPGTGKVTKGLVNYRRRPESAAAITDLDFFDLDYVFTFFNANANSQEPGYYVPPSSPYDTGVLDAKK
jgi:hypothetical protein